MSASRAADFRRCPLLYRLRAIDRVPEPKTRAQVLGTVVHSVLEELYGLVSIFDPDYFYSLGAFRERYIKSRNLTGDDDLVERKTA